MSKPRKIAELESLARSMVGDGGAPELYFVSDQGIITLVAREFEDAYSAWRKLAGECPRRECALESRRIGTIASVEPESDEPGARLIVIDDSRMFKLRTA